jgi:hypothetical protein
VIRHGRTLLAVALLIAACAQLSCRLNDYCLACEKGDGGLGDGSGSGDAGNGIDAAICVPTGPEICDGIDNDCNGMIDDGMVMQVGDACGTGLGACMGAVYQCKPSTPGDLKTDKLVCSKMPSAEICDGVDNNCNGSIDEGDPQGGARCGNGTGTCVQGVEHCVNGQIKCTGGTGPTTEVCDGLDNDCDGQIDNGLSNMGSCGATETECIANGFTPPCGACMLGTLSCVGGSPVCVGAVNPTLETCNNVDDDCDGKVDEDFNLTNDAQNCGSCGNVCGAGLAGGGHATWGCAASACKILSCNAGYHDNNSDPSDGCEFGPCFNSGAEVCDGVDNDCDGTIDETPAIGTPPAICATLGECAGTVAACPCANKSDAVGCATPGGWTCTYGATVSTDANGNIIPETKCDGLDNDCNGFIDDNQPPMRHADGTALVPVACHDMGIGACEGFGTYQCDPMNLNGPATCNITSPGGTPSPEKCNDVDDDCDGVVDEGNSSGSLAGQTWVAIGGGRQMMQYEASFATASNVDEGTSNSRTSNTLTIATTNGATEAGTTATITTNVAHGFSAGQRVTISGVGVAGYNGTFDIVAVPTATTFTVTLAASGLGASGGGTAATSCTFTVAATGASETGNTATFTTTTVHGLPIGKVVTVSGVGVSGYNGTYVVLTVPTTTTFTVTLAASGLAASGGGTVATECGSTCSRSAVMPRTNVTYLQALAACQAVGATLCSESAWHRACSAISAPSFPLAVDGTGTLIEAEDYSGIAYGPAAGITHAWVEDETPGFLGISAMTVNPNTGANITAANAPTLSPRLDYQINASVASANYHVCVRMLSPTGNDNTVWIGANNTLPGTANTTALTTTANNAWQWISSPALNVPTGTSYISLYMAKDAVKIDALYIINGTCPATPTDTNGPGGQWSFAANPNTYVGTTCNGHDYDATQDATIPTGTATQCFANFGTTGPYDLSGNVKEWAFAHQPGENPIRGGSSASTSVGIDCPLDFTLADDTFFFPDVGFRCCR